MKISKNKVLELTASKAKDEQIYYKNRITGSEFGATLKGDEIDIILAPSNDVIDWCRNLMQLGGILTALFFVYQYNKVAAFYILLFSMISNPGWLWAGIEITLAVKKRVPHIKNFKKINLSGHSLGGVVAQWVYWFIRIFLNKNIIGVTTGAPKMAIILNPLTWFGNMIHFVNRRDIVTGMPPFIFLFIRRPGKTIKVILNKKGIKNNHMETNYYNAIAQLPESEF